MSTFCLCPFLKGNPFPDPSLFHTCIPWCSTSHLVLGCFLPPLLRYGILAHLLTISTSPHWLCSSSSSPSQTPSLHLFASREIQPMLAAWKRQLGSSGREDNRERKRRGMPTSQQRNHSALVFTALPGTNDSNCQGAPGDNTTRSPPGSCVPSHTNNGSYSQRCHLGSCIHSALLQTRLEVVSPTHHILGNGIHKQTNQLTNLTTFIRTTKQTGSQSSFRRVETICSIVWLTLPEQREPLLLQLCAWAASTAANVAYSRVRRGALGRNRLIAA